jgi:hypothetical protein
VVSTDRSLRSLLDHQVGDRSLLDHQVGDRSLLDHRVGDHSPLDHPFRPRTRARCVRVPAFLGMMRS